MNLLDMRTVILGYAISNAICAAVITFLWLQNRKHFAGMGFWVADFLMQFVAIVLVALLGAVPERAALVASNALLILGTILLYVGLEHFVVKRGPQIHNAALLLVFILVHTYFLVLQPSLVARNVTISLGLLVLCLQAAWLMLYRVNGDMRPITRGVGITLAAFCVISIARIVVDFVVPPENDFFHADIYDTLLILTYQMLFIVLTFSLVLMVNRRLFTDLERDISERARSDDALRKSEERFRSLVETSSDWIWEVDRNSVYTYASPKVTDLLGYLPEELIGKTPFDLLEAKGGDRLISEIRGLMDRAEPLIAIENTNLHRDGHPVVLETSGVPILDAAGNLLGYRGIDRDITERRRAEELIQLRLRLWEYSATCPVDELMKKALDEIGGMTGSPIGFYHFVEEDQNTLSLQAWSTRTLQEFCKAEGRGLHYSVDKAGVWVDCVHQRKPVIHNNYAALAHRKGLPDGHAELVRELVVPTMRNERVVSVLGVGNKSSDYDEKDVEFVAYVADIVWSIVEHKRAEDALRQTNAELQARNEELDAFGHTVAHDLKNPLSSIIGFAYLLGDRETPLSDDEVRQMAGTIEQLGFKMDSIIEELMLLAGLRRAEVKMEPLDMVSIIAETKKRMARQIEESRAEVICPTSWPKVMGHAPWVEEVWTNYISNAVKYGGRPPHIVLGAAQEGDSVRFWTQDNGPGLSFEEQGRLFAPFERLGQTRLAGHGLGLSIVRRIVERMGGQVSVRSTGVAGEGSTFSFTLPAA